MPKELMDKGTEYEGPLSNICSLRLVQILNFLGLKNLCVAANVLLVSTESFELSNQDVSL